MAPHLKLQRWWSEKSSSVATTATPPSAVENLERRYAIYLPDDFKKYLLTSCPEKEFWDKQNTTWWQFDRIRNVSEEYSHKISNLEIESRRSEYLFFADHCIWCWAWAISCTNDKNNGKVAII